MKRERVKELLPILQAFAEGKEVEWQFDDEPNKEKWYPVGTDGIQGRTDCVYRIKPEPFECWVIEWADGELGSAFDHVREAQKEIDTDESNGRTIHMREVE